MINHLFTTKIVDLLISPNRWKVVSSMFTPDVKAISRTNPKEKIWRKRHTHKHSSIEFLFALSGTTYYGLAGKVYPCTTGSLFLFGAYESHDQGYPGKVTDVEHLWLCVLPERIIVRNIFTGENTQASWGAINLLLCTEDIGIDLFGIMAECRERKDQPESIRRMRLVSAIQSLMAYVVSEGYQGPVASKKNFQEDVINTICDHIKITVGNGDTINSLARLAGYSKYHFLRLFKSHTGRTVHEFINECRMHRTREMLAKGKMRTEISEVLGFSCLAAFSRWMRKNMADL